VRFAGTVATSPLPVELRADAWMRDQDGNLYRGTADVATPLPWWQRFPADLAADLWPGDLVASAHGAPEFHPVPAMNPDDLAAEARASGFCHDQRPAAAGAAHAP
jgi:hypothetical protein